MQIVRTFILSLLCLVALPLCAQDSEEDPEALEREAEIGERMQVFLEEYSQLANASSLQIRISESNIESGTYTRILQDKLNMLNTNLQSLDFRWNSFTQLEQPDIAESEQLMALMTQVETRRQAVSDTLAAQQRRCDAIADFLSAERFILAQDSTFARLYKQARALSLVQKTAPQLERVKAEEQALFAHLQDGYSKCKDAAALVPQLSKRAAAVEERYYSLKALDEKIQAMAYQPLIMRIKDYLMGLACVAVILIFFNMVVTKLQAVKKARQMLKKERELLNRVNGGGEYPTI